MFKENSFYMKLLTTSFTIYNKINITIYGKSWQKEKNLEKMAVAKEKL